MNVTEAQSQRLALLAKEAHKGQKRDDGSDYFSDHIVGVAEIVRSVYPTEQFSNENLWFALGLAYIHDLIEDCDEWMEKNDLRERLIEIFDGDFVFVELMHISAKYLTTSGPRAQYYSKDQTKTERIEELLIDSTINICLVKLCDRYHNICSMQKGNWNKNRQTRYLEQTKHMILAVRKNPFNIEEICNIWQFPELYVALQNIINKIIFKVVEIESAWEEE